jgi:hypothetical protein
MVLETGIGKAVDEASWTQAWEMGKKMNIAPPTAKNVPRRHCDWSCCCSGLWTRRSVTSFTSYELMLMNK